VRPPAILSEIVLLHSVNRASAAAWNGSLRSCACRAIVEAGRDAALRFGDRFRDEAPITVVRLARRSAATAEA